jgi:hypothetical protein
MGVLDVGKVLYYAYRGELPVPRLFRAARRKPQAAPVHLEAVRIQGDAHQ